VLGQIDYWSPVRPATSLNAAKGYGFIVVHYDDGHIEKFFALGSRLLFVTRPEVGQWVEFDISEDKPRKEHGFPLAENIRLSKSAEKGDGQGGAL
jgi:cold shock CspA family protein